MDWQQFNDDMNNMAQTMQQMMPQSMVSFNQPPMFHQAPQPPVMHQMAPSIQSHTFINVTHPHIQHQHQHQPQTNQIQSFVNQMQNFAQGMVNYSQQMVQYSQTLSNQMLHQHQPHNSQNHPNASIVLVDNFISPQIQHIHHNMQQMSNPFQSQAVFAQMNNVQNQNGNQSNHVIDLTGNDEEEDEDEEEKEEFVPWQDNDIPNEFKCPISLEIMSEPVICSDGFWYQRDCILDWLKNHNRSPMTNLPMQNPTIKSDQTLKTKIKEWILAQWTKYNQSTPDSSESNQEYDALENGDFEMDSEDNVDDDDDDDQEFDDDD